MRIIIAISPKDTSTKIGAVIVGEDNEIRSTGYNGLPRGCDDSVAERYEAPEKYYWFEHAERNAIYNAVRIGVSVKGCTLYTQGVPCADCARAVINAGIKQVIIHRDFGGDDRKKWSESLDKSTEMFRECGVRVVSWDGELVKPKKYLSGEVTELW